MLWDASAVKAYAIAGSDGQLGTVNDLLFEDSDWKIRWLVVDTGYWLHGRKVLIPVSALGHPDPAKREFAVKLTRLQIRQSPDAEKDLPVSRQAERRLYDYYGWDPYWTTSYFGGGSIAAPFVPPLFHSGSVPRDPGTVDTSQRDGDPHLRSVEVVTGYHVHATDGDIGHVEDFLLDDAKWNFRYIKVDTKNWWPGARVLISPHSIRSIDVAQKRVELNVSRKKVRESPPYDASNTVDGAYDETFLTYYGIKWVQP
jgi:uncharacterized protein YrrD